MTAPTSARTGEFDFLESIIADRVAHLVAAPLEALDGEIVTTLRSLCAVFGADRATLWVTGADGAMAVTHAFCDAGLPVLPLGAVADAIMPWTAGQLRAGRPVVLPSVDALPPEGVVDRLTMARFGSVSLVAVPFTSPGGGGHGALSFGSTRRALAWSESALARCRLLAQVLNSVLARARADADMRTERARLRALIDSAAGDLIWCVDPDEHRLLMHNRAFAEWWRERGRVLGPGSTPEEAFSDDPGRAGRWREIYRRTREEGSFALEYASADGDHHLHFHFNVVESDGACVGISGFGRDVTHERRASAELARVREQFLQAQKMEALGRLAGGVAHDFNNLLTVICGVTQEVAAELGPDSPWAPDLEDVLGAGRRASALTQQLLAFSRRQAREVVVVDVAALVRDAEKLLGRVLGEDVALRAVVPDAEALVMADPSQLHQVVVNLAVNARDAMPRGGELVVALSTRDLRDVDAEERGDLAPGPYVVIEVRDTGDGMSPDVLARAFEPFFTTKERGKGTGLGLATVLGIVQQSGGDIRLVSEPGRGTIARVLLPRASRGAEQPARADETALVEGTESVLVVEDDAQVRAVVARVLRRSGYDVHLAPDGASALRLLAEQRGRFELLLTDVVMPAMSGPDLVRQVRAEHPGQRVLFMTGFSDVELRDLEALSGAPVLAKPFTPRGVSMAVRAALDAPRRARRG